MAGNGNSGGANRKKPEVHLLRGTFRKHRHHQDVEAAMSAAVAPGSPERPPRNMLTATGWKEYERLEQLLDDEGRLTRSDGPLLFSAARSFEVLSSIRRKAARARGELVLKWHRAEFRASDAYLKCIMALCLTASTRGRAPVTKREKPMSHVEKFRLKKSNDQEAS